MYKTPASRIHMSRESRFLGRGKGGKGYMRYTSERYFSEDFSLKTRLVWDCGDYLVL